MSEAKKKVVKPVIMGFDTVTVKSLQSMSKEEALEKAKESLKYFEDRRSSGRVRC